MEILMTAFYIGIGLIAAYVAVQLIGILFCLGAAVLAMCFGGKR